MRQVSELERLICGGENSRAETSSIAPNPPIDSARKHIAPFPIPPERAVAMDDLSIIQGFISEATEHLQAAEAELLKIEQEHATPDSVNAIFRSFHTIKGVAGFLNLQQISALAHASESLLDLARKNELRLNGRVVDLILEATDAAKSLIASLEKAARCGDVPARIESLPDLIARLRECAVNRGRADSMVAAPQADAAASASLSTSATIPASISASIQAGGTDQFPAPADPHDNSASDSSVKVPAEQLDHLISLVGELVIAQSRASQDLLEAMPGNQRLSRNLGHVGTITHELHDLAMSMRLAPIQSIFQKMTRLVRDLAHKSGKMVELVVAGGQTELNRNAVEAISDSLVHMIRNSIDHGIEHPEARARLGKPRVGRIALKAFQQDSRIVIEISDDGRGLDQQSILKKAIESGIVHQADAAALSDQQIFQLIYRAGLTTAEIVTEVSGRGVGMDVVRRNVEALHGQIDIASQAGAGTSFIIRIPLRRTTSIVESVE